MQPGGSQYGAPPTDMTSQFSSSSGGDGGAARAQMLGISAAPDQLLLQQQHQTAPLDEAASEMGRGAAESNYEKLVAGGGGGGGGFGDDDVLTAATGEEGERGVAPGNRWPRQETLVLLKIRSEMDAAFRDATLKGPLWEDVSRKMAELGYNRSGKKCKEKFENVHKYYKRTKDSRAGRQDGKSYRFFSQLEALQAGGGGAAASLSSVPVSFTSPVGLAGPSSRAPPEAAFPISAISPHPPTNPSTMRVPMDDVDAVAGGGILSSAAAAGIRFSSSTSASSSDDSGDGETEEWVGGGQETSRKRKRGGGDGSSSSRKIMAFFDGLMKQVMERQELMMQRFLETLEKREQDRIIREEAWRRQEMGRQARELEHMAQERVMAANRDAAVIVFLQKVTGQAIQLPVTPTPLPQPSPQSPTRQPQYRPPPPPSHPTPAAVPQAQQVQQTPQNPAAPSTSSVGLVPIPEPRETKPASGGYEGLASSSRWPKSEIHALIELRSGLDSRYQDAVPKGPLWEDISSEMKKLGYSRSSKRCKEKWENINKYYKKMKESNKTRPYDAKTCPYFHQLDALYQKKKLASSAVTASDALSTSPPPATVAPPQPDTGAKNGGSVGIQTQTSNGSRLTASFFEEPEDIMKEVMDQQQHQNQAVTDGYDKLDEGDRVNMDEDYYDDDEEDEDDGKMQYTIQFQRQNGGANTRTAPGNPSANPPPTTTTTAAGSFLAVVQ